MGRRKPPVVHGLVLIDKPRAMTSHDAVQILRRRFGERRVGHTGTLDPDATGLLVCGVGNATRLFRFMENFDKQYICEIVLGVETDTLDDTGTTVKRHAMAPPDMEDVRRIVAERFIGVINQVPPMVSALHHEGRRLHQLAREGIEVPREPREVMVSAFDVEATSDGMVLRADVTCGSGTYVRSLGADLGTALGGGAHIRNLRRLRIGPYSVDEATAVDEPVLLPLIEAVRGMERHVLGAAEIDDVLYGRTRRAWDGEGPWAALDPAGELVAVFERWQDDVAKPTVVFGGR